jgi:hypothetical protein
MNSNEVDILLVDDSRDDIDLTLHALRSENLANRVFIARVMAKKPWIFCSVPDLMPSVPSIVPRSWFCWIWMSSTSDTSFFRIPSAEARRAEKLIPSRGLKLLMAVQHSLFVCS